MLFFGSDCHRNRVPPGEAGNFPVEGLPATVWMVATGFAGHLHLPLQHGSVG